MEEEGPHRLRYHWPCASAGWACQRLEDHNQSNHNQIPQDHSPEDAGASFSIWLSPDPTESTNKGECPAQLGPAMGGVGTSTSTTSGVGLATQVTLCRRSRIVGREVTFPLDAALFGWVGGLTGAMFKQTRQRA